MAARIANHGIDTAFKSSQRGRVTERVFLFDQTMNQCPRCLGFPLAYYAFGIEHTVDGRKPVSARWRAHLFDDHAAQRQTPFNRTNICPRQISIGWNVTLRELFEA